MGSSKRQGKASKGAVVVREMDGRLRLVWSFAGKRYFLSLGLPDTSINRSAAEFKAKLIERDIATDQFDRSLAKYRPASDHPAAMTVLDLFDRFYKWKSTKVDERTLEKYRALRTRLEEHFAGFGATMVFEREAEKFQSWLLERQKPVTVRDRMSTLKGCWAWAMKQGYVNENPWAEVRLKVAPQQRPKPFTKEEIHLIIKTIREDQYYAYYADFVEFLFGTGCRTGEAIGLRWKHVAEDCSSCWIGEIITRNHKRKSTKTNRDRVIPMLPRLQEILRSRRPEPFNPEALVFPAMRAESINDNDFRAHVWVSILKKAGIPYRKPYLTRSTLVSHALDEGMSPVLVSELTGHRVDTIYRHYAGNVRSRPQFPDVFS